MQLKKVHGLAAADSVLKRIDPLDLSSLPDAALQRTRDLFGLDATPESSVLQMLRDVRADGDSAVRRYAKLLDNADVGDLEVPAAELDGAWEATPDDLKRPQSRRRADYPVPRGDAAPRLGRPGRRLG